MNPNGVNRKSQISRNKSQIKLKLQITIKQLLSRYLSLFDISEIGHLDFICYLAFVISSLAKK